MGTKQTSLRSGAIEATNPMSMMVLPTSLPEVGKARLQPAMPKMSFLLKANSNETCCTYFFQCLTSG